MKLYRIIFPVTDIATAASYYSHIFGQPGTRVSPGRHYFDLEGTLLACYDPIADGDEIQQPWQFHENQYIYIAVADIEAVYQRVRNDSRTQDVTSIENMLWGERLFYVHDPFGNPVCFVDEKTIFMGS